MAFKLFKIWAWKRLFMTIRDDLFTLWYAIRDPQTPRKVKLLSLLLPVYLVSPIDLVPDFLILLGIVDDLVIVPVGIRLLLKLVPEPVLTRCRAKALARTGGPAGRDRP
jgi:uncharacterized membrane protein YkvA (DUF1232 family)